MTSLDQTFTDKDPVFRVPVTKPSVLMISFAETMDWGLKKFKIPQLWESSKGEGIKVGIADTGIATQHGDLKSQIKKAKDFTRSRTGVEDVAGHGTHVAGTIAATEDGNGIIGVAPKASLYIAKVLGDDGSGSAESVAAGVNWLVQQKVDIISMSLGSPYNSPIIERAVLAAMQANVIVVAAAGNEGPRLDTVGYPGALPGVITVGAVNINLDISRFSSRGQTVDICAPGEEILSTYPPNSYAKLSGTSMATPFVSGVVALMLSKHRKFNSKTPLTTQEEVLEHLRKTAIDVGPQGFDPSYGYGLIDPTQLLAVAEEHGSVGGTDALSLTTDDLTESGKEKLAKFAGEAGVLVQGRTNDGRGFDLTL